MIPRIHVFAAPADEFFVNSFIVEGKDELVVIDVQFLISSAQALVTRITELSKPLAAIIVTHPHPDHFNGLGVVLKALGDVPVYANRATVETIQATRQAKRDAWTPVYGDDYPQDDACPTHMIGQDETLRLASVDFRVIGLGAGESTDNTIIHIPAADAVIASDLIYNECHPWLAEHRSQLWLEQLDRVEAEFGGVAHVYAGHGPKGGRELFERQRQYILQFQELIAANTRNGRLDEAGLATVRAATINERRSWPLDGLIEMNAEAMVREIASTVKGQMS
jgi:glyoxylase-like metal-dependent hydrolase (beta-lactamase superfamily II)